MPNLHLKTLKTQMLKPQTFVSAAFSGQQKGHNVPWRKVTIRPVLIKDQYHLQISYLDDKQDITKNYLPIDAEHPIDALLAQPFNSLQVQTQNERLRVQVTKKGKTILHRQRTKTITPNLNHDHKKEFLLSEEEVAPFMQIIGLMRADGQVKAGKRAKFQQINELLKIIDQSKELHHYLRQNKPLRVVDCGCGSADLSFAIYHYLHNLRGAKVLMEGVDLKQDLLAQRTAQAQALGWSDLCFTPWHNY